MKKLNLIPIILFCYVNIANAANSYKNIEDFSYLMQSIKKIKDETKDCEELDQNSQTFLTKIESLKLKTEKIIELSQSIEENTTDKDTRYLIQEQRLKLRQALQQLEHLELINSREKMKNLKLGDVIRYMKANPDMW